MRQAFVRALSELAERDPRIMLMTADLGYTVVEEFALAHPRQFLNVGVAEQNMLGMATGIAAEGFLPFVYSIAPFAVLRPFEFIRNGAVLHNLPVRIVAVGAGVEYGSNGPSHYALEDVALMRSLPGMAIITPADGPQSATALRATWETAGPVYYRLGKDDRRIVPGLEGRFEAGGATLLREGHEVALLTTGSISNEVELAVRELAEAGVSTAFAVISQISPPPEEFLRRLLFATKLVVTVESHYVTGGLGTILCELAASVRAPAKILRLGFDRMPVTVSGPESLLLRAAGLDATSICRRVRDAMKETA